MTQVSVNSGICGFSVTIKAKKVKDKKIQITLDTDCDMVKQMNKDISKIDIRAAFAGHLSNPVHMSAARHLKHVACPVPTGILKAIEVEAGVCLPEDVSIIFLKDKRRR
jgi:hypothetical protein